MPTGTMPMKRSLARVDLFRELDDMRRRMEESFGRRLPMPRLFEREEWSPTIDMYEEDGALVVRADLPGVESKDVKVSLTDDILTVQGERKREKEIKEEDYYSHEAWYGQFMRRIAVPSGTKPEGIKAGFRNGVLEVRVPKVSAPKPKEIPIQE